jgi:hypothetical protein
MRVIGKRSLGYSYKIYNDMVVKTYSDAVVMSYPFQRVPAAVSDSSEVYVVDDQHVFVVGGNQTAYYMIDNFIVKN